MPPKVPELGAEVSDAEIKEALAAVDLRIAELHQTRAEWVALLSESPGDDSGDRSVSNAGVELAQTGKREHWEPIRTMQRCSFMAHQWKQFR